MLGWGSVCTRLGAPAAAFLLLTAAPARGNDIYVAAGDNLQAAIDLAQPGDRLLLAPGATFVGNFRLTNKGGSTEFITIRSAAADMLLPADGVRIHLLHGQRKAPHPADVRARLEPAPVENGGG